MILPLGSVASSMIWITELIKQMLGLRKEVQCNGTCASNKHRLSASD